MEFKKEYIPLVFVIIIAVIKICKDTKIIESAKSFTPTKKEYTKTITQSFTTTKKIMTAAELYFYHSIKEVLTSEHVIFTKVRMEDIIQVKPRLQNKFSLRNKIKSKHIDFVICDAQTGEIQRAIELNDSSHDRQDRIDRDIFVNKAFESAGIPLLTMKIKKNYSRKDIENLFYS